MSSQFTWRYSRTRSAVLLNFPNGEQLSIAVSASDIDHITGLMLRQETRKAPENTSLDDDTHTLEREEA